MTTPSTSTAKSADDAVRLTGISKSYGAFTAVHPLELAVPAGSFFALLGASGCGKTTTLRMIAGLETPSAGAVHLGGRDVTALPPYKRPVNTVFQNYALFPHLDVYENVAFGLRRRGIKSVRGQVGEMLDLVQLGPLARRRPHQLSGGQQQRVAVARALINRPQVLLLDEPLGALDLKLRRQMQLELKRIQTEVGITFIHVTHDQEEAMTMADTVAVMNAGRVEQMGAPADLYENPASTFVANFLGTSNLIEAEVTAVEPARHDGHDARDEDDEHDGHDAQDGQDGQDEAAGTAASASDGSGTGAAGGTLRLACAGQQLTMPAARCRTGAAAGTRVLAGVRPEKITLVHRDDQDAVPAGRNRISGRITDSSFIGVSTQYVVDSPVGAGLEVFVPNVERDARLVPGAPVVLHWNPEHTFGLDAGQDIGAGLDPGLDAGPEDGGPPPAAGSGSGRPEPATGAAV